MTGLLAEAHLQLLELFGEDWVVVVVMFFPFVIAVEMPLYLLIVGAYLKRFFDETHKAPSPGGYCPMVSCLLICYNEGERIRETLRSLSEQIYRGRIETLVLVDGADANKETLEAAREYEKAHRARGLRGLRDIKVIPKAQRGGRVSSNNLGLHIAKGEIIIIIDGDCVLDNDLVARAVSGFADPSVVASSGDIRVRNVGENVLTRLQALEYMTGLQLSKTGLAELGMLNNVSGAHGIFRRSFVKAVGGWKNGTAEDLDLTIRMKSYLKRYPGLKMIHSYDAVMHTDVPSNVFGLIRQRLRWDGDISFLYFRRFHKLMNPFALKWRNFFAMFWYDMLFCLVVPFLSTAYFLWMLFEYPFSTVLAALAATYCYYFCVASLMFFLYWVFVSERKLKDLKLVWCILLMPVYQFMMRFVSAYATVAEFVLASHKDTSMAPWWVIRKTH